ncbi:MAG TPA: MBL fold metallo-hydrolase, partial [Terrimicrobiaceae bacterium]
PKKEGFAALPDFRLVPEGGVDSIIVTHAHQDHVGTLPFLTRREPKARVFMTEPTSRIADVMLHNSVNVMLRQREEHGIANYPLFTHRGVELSRQSWQPCHVGRQYDLSGDRNSEMTFEFFHSGHVLGAVGVMIRAEGKSIFYSGDVNFENQTLIRGATFPEASVDVLLMETTRGDSPTPLGYTRANEEERLMRAIREAFGRGGSVTIPLFALGKTQELLAMFWRMRLRGLLAPVPIYIGGLSTKLSGLYDAMSRDPQRAHSELHLLHELAPYVLSGNEVHTISPRKKCIFALSSGMMTENTLSNIFARRVLGEENQSLFFVGYSDPESPAGRIRASHQGDEVILDQKLPPVELRCHMEEFNFSAHANRESLLTYAIALRPKKIILIHGDRPAVEWYQLKLFRELPETEVIIPEPGKSIVL